MLHFGTNTVDFGASPAPAQGVSPLARLFLVARTERGPVGQAVALTDATQFRSLYGAGSQLAGTDAALQILSGYFRAAGRGARATVLRLVEGDTAKQAAEKPGDDEKTKTPKLGVKLTNPGAYGNNFFRRWIRDGDDGTYTLEVEERIAGIARPRKSVAGVTVDAAGALKIQAALGALVEITYSPAGTIDVYGMPTAGGDGGVQATGVSDVLGDWLPFAGGADSAALTGATLTGAVDTDTQVRTGLSVLQSTDYGTGPVVCADGNDALLNEAMLAWAQDTGRIALIAPGGPVTPDGAVQDKRSLESVPGASYGAYYYPLARQTVGGVSTNVSALGYVAGQIVAGINGQRGFVQPPAGVSQVPDVQRAADGRSPLVHETNARALDKQGVNVLIARNNSVEIQGLSLIAADPLQPATAKIYQRMLLLAIAYDLGPVLAAFANLYVDSRGTFHAFVKGRVGNVLRPYYDAGVLYGDTPEEAYSVGVTFELDSSNEDRSGRALIAVRVRISPVNEGSDLEIFNVPVTVPLT